MNDPLIIDRMPFLLIERGKIIVHENSIVVEKNNKKQNIPIRNIHLLLLGNGTSITSEAMSVCSKHNCYIAQCKGGANIHTIHHAGVYKNPKKLIDQVLKSQDNKKRIETAKYILTPKTKFAESISNIGLIEKLENYKTLEEILGLEGFVQKTIYKHIFGDRFKRSVESDINKNINICNSILYNFIASLVVCLGYSPSIGFVHGHTRRGALVFDIADMFKYKIHNNPILFESKNIGRQLFEIITANNNEITRNMIKEIEIVCT